MGTLLMVGTRKGLWLGRSDDDRREWEWQGPLFDMEDVYSAAIDKRGGSVRLFAGPSSSWVGPKLTHSDDLGASWVEGKIAFPDGTDASLERIWQIQPDPVDDAVVWAGTEPGAIFRSADRGETFDLVRGLWDHPHRTQWGAGYGGQAFHTIVPHASDPQRMIAAISSGGAYVTADGGATWAPHNTGVQAEFNPPENQYPEFGQCVHKIARHPAEPERLYLQNHGGVYRSDDAGEHWVSIEEGLPARFGFSMVVHPHQPGTIFVFPLGGSGQRYPVDGQARVWRSRDAGEHWEALGDGQLPDGFFVGVMRDAMCTDDHGSADDPDETGLYFGARNGSVWGSPDGGATWAELHSGLPDVMCVRAASI